MNISLAIKYFFMSVFGLCVTLLLIIPLLCPFVFVFFLWYSLVKLILKVKYGDSVYKASGTDVTHGRQTDLSVPVINAAVRVHGNLSVDRIKAQMNQMIETSFNTDGQKRYRRLRELYSREFGYNVWREFKNFDINDHVQVVHLVNDDVNINDKLANNLEKLNDKNLNYVEMLPLEQNLYILNEHSDIDYRFRSNEDDLSFQSMERATLIRQKSKASWNIVLKKLLNKYGAEPFSDNLPPWSVLVLDEGEQMYTVLFRFHHAISDGIYFSRMFCEDILDETVKVFQSYQPPPKIIRCLTSFWAFCLLPFGLREMLSKNDNNSLHGPKLTGKKATLNEVAQSPAMLATNTLITIICYLLPEELAKALLSVKGCTMALSNLPGGQVESKIWGGTLVDQIFWVPDRDPMGVGFSILSYNGSLRVGVVLDESLLPNEIEGDCIMNDFETEVNNILKELNEETVLEISQDCFSKDSDIPL